MTNQRISNKQEYNILTTIRNILTKNNAKEELLSHKNIEYNTVEILLAILEKIQEQGYYELSLKEEDIKEYIINIKEILQETKTFISYFSMKSLDLCCKSFKQLLIQTVYEIDYGYYDEEKEILTLNIEGYNFYKNLDEKTKKIINKCSEIIIKQSINNKTHTKKLKQ